MSSPGSSIVHHLLGPDRYAHTRTLLRISRSTYWSVFQDGSNGEPTGQRPEHADAEARRRRALPTTIEEMEFHEHIESPGFGRPPIDAGPRPESIGRPAHRRSTSFSGLIAGPHPLPSRQFQALFDSLFKVLFIFPSRRALGLMASGATCVQRLNGSRDSAIHTKYRISLYSSSMREPRYPLPRVIFVYSRSTGPHRGSLVAHRAVWARALGTGEGARARCWSTPPAQTLLLLNTFVGSFCDAGFDNDPTAGLPTETLLRLLLPVNDKVQWTSRDVAGSEPPTLPQSNHFTGLFNR
ncbi:hypothetical protein CQW23_31236 [Capsicum baccatum]|uniref:Protein TAR1 n=1 Tax=Capsicum baccatum TaxID=33114 RepID=A0A2G2V860_CAPBA|nr:hypothetical protein CQW23_31236 [Capsicum baccatum]